MRGVSTVDVAGGDLSGDDLVGLDREVAAVVGHAAHAGEIAADASVENEHLATTAGRRRRLAIHARK